MDNILLKHALEYADKGWYVFPCREKDSEPFWDDNLGEERIMRAKSPYFAGGFEIATRDREQIIEWWTKLPEAAIGISCGASGLVVVDIDTKEGRKGFDNFMSLNVSKDGALQSLTPSGGMHIIYSGMLHSHANIKAGIDLRASGGYIVAPPSFIYDERGKKRFYIASDDWTKTPVSVPSDLVTKLQVLRGKYAVEKEQKEYPPEELESLLQRAKRALEKLPPRFCDDYFLWVDVGLALKSLGDDAFALWNDWSQKSSKYDYKACEYRWNRFEPRVITIASLFYWAKQESTYDYSSR